MNSDPNKLQWQAHHQDQAEVTRTKLDPRTVDQAGEGAALAAAARAPGVGAFRDAEKDGSFSLLLFEVGKPDGSWAACDYEPGKAEFKVTQYGGRRLWDEITDAYVWWVTAGEPDYQRFGLTVGLDRQELWLDDPANVVPGCGASAH